MSLRLLLSALARLAAVLLLYQAARIVFFLYNHDLFADVGAGYFLELMAAGARFDLSAVVYTNAVCIILWLLPLELRHHRRYQRLVSVIFVATNAVAITANTADVAYYRFTLQRTTASIFHELGQDPRILLMVLRCLAEFWPVTLVWVASLVALVAIDRRIGWPQQRPNVRPFVYYPVNILVMAIGIFLSVAAMSGGIPAMSHRPINMATAGEHVAQAHHMALVLNTPFTLIRTIDKRPLAKVSYFVSDEEARRLYSPIHEPVTGRAKRLDNVVILILESFGAEHIGSLNPHLEGGHYRGYTPFLDELMQKGRAYNNAFANGLKSIDALPSVTAGIPGLVEHYVLSDHATNRFESLASLLKRKGYATAFFHGARNGSMGFGAFTHLAGFDAYYGMDEYGNDADDDGTWGIWDEEFLQFFAKRLGELESPFLGVVFTLSSHQPFTLPERYKDAFPQGAMFVEKSLSYSDMALRKFFAAAETMPWYEHTLFVLTADHGSSFYRPEFETTVGRFRVPLVFFAPGDGELVGWDARPAQQIDILPTVLGYLGYDEPYVGFGHDLLDPASPRFAVNYREGTFQLLDETYALHFDGRVSTGLYAYQEDRLLEHNLLRELPDVQAPRERLLEAVIQEYTNRMVDNRLTVTR